MTSTSPRAARGAAGSPARVADVPSQGAEFAAREAGGAAREAERAAGVAEFAARVAQVPAGGADVPAQGAEFDAREADAAARGAGSGEAEAVGAAGAGGLPGGSGPALAVRLAAEHLRALGCRVEQAPAGRSGGADALALVAYAGGVRARCDVTWAGPVGLALRDEADVQAACGLTHVHGRRYGGPTPLGVDYATCVAGALAATGTLAALVGGVGGVGGVSGGGRDGEDGGLAGAGAASATGSAAGADADRAGSDTAVTGEAAGGGAGRGIGPGGGLGVVRVSTSVAQAALLAVGQYLAAATAEGGRAEAGGPGGPPFESGDGVRFEAETLDPDAWRGFWTALGADPGDAGRGWRAFQHRYATAVCPLPPALHEATTRCSMRQLELYAREYGVDLTPVAPAPRPPADGGSAAWRLRPAGPAVHGRHPGGEALSGGTPGAAAPGATAAGAAYGSGDPGGRLPLAGVTVVEVCRRVQGPLAGLLLGLLGARVVRVEPVGGDPMRGMPPMAGGVSARFAALNRGKEAVEADLGAASGRAAVRELALGADVFLHSLAPGKDRFLGLDADTLTAARPGLVHAAASGWGDERGELPPVGTDFPVQAWSGLAALVTPPGLPPTPSLLTLTDVLGGVLCAEAAVAGLLAARLTGRGQAVTSSLLSAARLLCEPRFRTAAGTAAGRPRAAVPGRADLAGLAADPRFASALDRGDDPGPCTFARTPWGFGR